jgi:hypothetical protein
VLESALRAVALASPEGVAVATDDRPSKAPWEAPRAAALTDAESRAEDSDVWMQNGGVIVT